MAAYVEHESAVLKAWSIYNVHDGERVFCHLAVFNLCHYICREHLLYALERVVEAVGSVGGDGDTVRGDVESVTLVAEFLATVVHAHLYQGICFFFLYCDAVACHFFEKVGELLRLGTARIIQSVCGN